LRPGDSSHGAEKSPTYIYSIDIIDNIFSKNIAAPKIQRQKIKKPDIAKDPGIAARVFADIILGSIQKNFSA
jgi:hypothetical protein